MNNLEPLSEFPVARPEDSILIRKLVNINCQIHPLDMTRIMLTLNATILNNMPTTIFESFSTGFSGASVASSASSGAHVSGSTTEACDPPGFALEIPYQTYAAIADTALNQCESSLSQKYLADWETGIILRSEGDVVASSAVYLNNPVQLALEATAEKIYTHRSEVTQGSRTRADKIYYRHKTSFAVLDYKMPGVLNRSEFQYGIIRSYDNFAAARYQGRTNRYYDNLELRFARTLLKQSVHYSEAYRTPFIALFDWNTLILLVLHKREDSRGGDYCYITIVDDRKRFRKALLGFLLIAGGDGDTGSKVRVIKPTKEVDYQRRWDTDERNPSLYERKDRPSRAGAKKPEGLYNQSFQSESEYNDRLQRGRPKARDKYYPPTANTRPKHVSSHHRCDLVRFPTYHLAYAHPVRQCDICLPGLAKLTYICVPGTHDKIS